MIQQKEKLSFQDRLPQKQARQMHKAVFGLVGIWLAFTVTFLIAGWRVSQSGKYSDAHLNSWTLEGKASPTASSQKGK